MISLVTGALLTGCVTEGPRPAAPSAEPFTISSAARMELERRVRERMAEEETIFAEMNEKMDAYQDLLAACQGISDRKENEAIRESCDSRLAAMRLDLIRLSNSLRDDGDAEKEGGGGGAPR